MSDQLIKEATKIEIPNFPTIAQLSAWRAYVKTALVEASGRKSETPVIAWIQEAEVEGTRPEDFEESGDGFETLDRKLAASLIRVTKGELARKIHLESQRMNAKSMVLKGRQVYWMILSAFRTNPNMGVVYGVRDISKVQWLGDEKLETFQSNWFTVINQLRNPMGEGQLAEVLLELLENSKDMKDDIGHYRRVLAADPSKTYDYQYLLDTIDRHIALKSYKLNQQNLTRAIEYAGRGAPTAPAPSKAKTPCKFHAAGGCDKGKGCAFSHSGPIGGGGGKGKSSEKGKGSGKPRSQSPSGDKKSSPCFKFQLGTCPHSAKECQYAHRKLTEDEKGNFDRFKKAGPKPSSAAPAPPQGACPEWKKKGSCVNGDSCSFEHADKDKPKEARAKSRAKAKSMA